MIMKITLILALLIALGCTQTINLGYRWDKNTEPDMSHYDIFVVTAPDCLSLWEMSQWPAHEGLNIYPDSTEHYPNLLAVIAHIHDSPIDSVVFYYDQKMEQGSLRAWFVAVDSLLNKSFMAGSINAVYIGDREAPLKPTNNLVFKRP